MSETGFLVFGLPFYFGMGIALLGLTIVSFPNRFDKKTRAVPVGRSHFS